MRRMLRYRTPSLVALGFLWSITVVLAVFILAMPCWSDEEQIDYYYREFYRLYQARQYENAAQLAETLGALTKTRYGANSREYARTLTFLGDTYFDRHLYREAEDAYQRALIIHSSRSSPDDPRLIVHFAPVIRAVIAQTKDQPAKLGAFEVLVDKLQRLLAAGPMPVDATVALAFREIGSTKYDGHGFDKAIYFLIRAQHLFEVMRPRHEAQSAQAQSALDDQVLSVTHLLGLAFKQAGDYARAEQQLKHALKLAELMRDRDPESLARVLNDLGNILSSQDRCEEAIGLYQASLKLGAAAGREMQQKTQQNLSNCYLSQGKFDDAEALLRDVITSLERSPDAGYFELFRARSNLAALFGLSGKTTKAIPILLQNLDVAQKARDRLAVAVTASSLASSYLETHSTVDALPLAHRALNLTNRLIGVPPAANPVLIGLLAEIGRILLQAGETTEAYEVLQRAMALHARRHRMSTDAQEIAGQFERIADQIPSRAHPVRTSVGNPPGSALVAAAWQLEGNRKEVRETLIREAFRAMQSVEQHSAASALVQTTARLAAADNDLAPNIREMQDLSRRWRDVDARVLQSQVASALDGQAADSIPRAELAEIEARLGTVADKVAREFPQYWAIANPPALELTDAQRLLMSDEALVAYFVDADATYVWALTHEQAEWRRIAIGKDELTNQIRVLRCGLDYRGEWSSDDGRARCLGLLNLKQVSSDRSRLPFNLESAYKLHQNLLGQFNDLIKDKRLLIVPSGPLTSLPFQVLVTEKPQVAIPANADYRGVPWLGRSHANSVLPSVASLKALRELAAGKALEEATSPYIAFGNPLLSGPRETDRRAWVRQSCSKLSRPDPLHVVGSAIQQGIAEFFRGGLANLDKIRRQNPLPETADELCFVARLLRASNDAVYLGEKATERNLKLLSANGTLARARIVHFATHGLLAGETESLATFKAEPALLLTPPDVAGDEDDGLLTASEIAQLKFNADWVVLSACNTAGGEKLGAEALSGLARAFFYAGARALLVSHWYVNSDASVRLITQSFAELRAAPKIGRAEALHRSMLAFMDKDRASAHPVNWAPFVVVGEGAQ